MTGKKNVFFFSLRKTMTLEIRYILFLEFLLPLWLLGLPFWPVSSPYTGMCACWAHKTVSEVDESCVGCNRYTGLDLSSKVVVGPGQEPPSAPSGQFLRALGLTKWWGNPPAPNRHQTRGAHGPARAWVRESLVAARGRRCVGGCTSCHRDMHILRDCGHGQSIPGLGH